MIHFFKNQIKFSARHFVRDRSWAKQVFCILELIYGYPTISISRWLKEFTTLDNRGKHWCSQYILDLTTVLAGHHQEGTRLDSARSLVLLAKGRVTVSFSSGWWFFPSYSAKAADDPEKHSLRASADTQQAHAHHQAITSAGQYDSSCHLHHAQHKVLPVQ